MSVNAAGNVTSKQKIGHQVGGLQEPLDDDDLFGMTVAPIGDVDRDGVPDIVVGSNRDDDGGADKGALFFLLLNANGTVKHERKVSAIAGGFNLGIRTGERFGRAMGWVGDLRGDGSSAIVVGAGAGLTGGGGAVYVLDFAPFAADVETLPVSTGGAQSFTLDAGPDQAGKLYLVLGSLSGTAPGLPLGGVTLPLNPDAYFQITGSTPGIPVVNGLGNLDGAGMGAAALTLPGSLPAQLAGLVMHHAYLVVGQPLSFDLTSNAVAVRFN